MKKLVKREDLAQVLSYIKSLPEGTEVTTFEIAKELLDKKWEDMDYLFELDYKVRSSAWRKGLVLDSTKYDDMETGLPYHVGYVIRKRRIFGK